jgi:hypothetical protein
MELVSSDGHTLTITKRAQGQMGILRDLPWDRVPVPSVSADTLARIVAWCEDKTPIPDEHLLEVCLAANYLDIDPLLEHVCRRIAATFSVDELKETCLLETK